MPRGFVDDPEGDVTDEEVNDSGFGDDILAADADGIDVLLLNVGQHHTSAVTDDLCRSIDDKGIGCVPESLFYVHSERLLAVVRKGEFAVHSFRSVLDCGFRCVDLTNLRHIEFRLSLIGIQPVDFLLNVVKLCVAEAEHGRILQERFGQSLIACNKLFLSLRCVAVL